MAKFRILVVDDEEDVRTIERIALSPRYEVVEARDGLDALEKLERAEPDLVVLDIMMPLMDGIETCRAIRKNPKFRDIPVLFLSVRKEKAEIKEGYEAGANLYLTKPFDPDRLVKNIERFFEESKAEPRKKRFTIEQLEQIERDKDQARMASAKPVAKAQPATTADKAAAPPGRRTTPDRPRVMIVDDNADLLEMLRIALADDFEVTTAQNGIEAVEKIIDYEPDLIVLDAMLPKMSGYQLCISLRRNRNFSQTPIIFISAKSSQRDQEYCWRLGANEFIAKPFEPEMLRRRLLSYARSPQFTIRPKRLTYEQIRVREKAELSWAEQREQRAEDLRLRIQMDDYSGREKRT